MRGQVVCEVVGMGQVLCNICKPISKLIVLSKHMSKLDRCRQGFTQVFYICNPIEELLRGFVFAVYKPNNQLRITQDKHTLTQVLLVQFHLLQLLQGLPQGGQLSSIISGFCPPKAPSPSREQTSVCSPDQRPPSPLPAG